MGNSKTKSKTKPTKSLHRFGRVALLVVGGFFLCGVTTALAKEKSRTESARAHAEMGNAYFNLEKYKEALQEYEQAYLDRQDPGFLFNIAQCHRVMGKKPEAIRFYQKFIQDTPNHTNRPQADQWLRELQAGSTAPPVAAVAPAPARPAAPAPVAAPAPRPPAPAPVAVPAPAPRPPAPAPVAVPAPAPRPPAPAPVAAPAPAPRPPAPVAAPAPAPRPAAPAPVAAPAPAPRPLAPVAAPAPAPRPPAPAPVAPAPAPRPAAPAPAPAPAVAPPVYAAPAPAPAPTGQPYQATAPPPYAAGTPGQPGASPMLLAVPADAAPAPDASGTPVYKKWWFWTLIGVVVVGGVVAGVALSGDKMPPCPMDRTCF